MNISIVLKVIQTLQAVVVNNHIICSKLSVGILSNAEIFTQKTMNIL